MTHRRSIRFLGPLVLAVLLSTAGCPRPAPVRPEPPPGRITNAARVSAMVSVHASARWGKEANFPPGLHPITLSAAIETLLADDRDPRALSRRRRAIAKLAAYRLREFKSEIGALGADPEKIEEALDEHSKDAHFNENASEKETFVNDMLGEKFAIVGCPWTQLFTWVFGTGPSMIAVAQVSVTRAVDDVARALDPQSWDQCSALFPETFLAKYQGGTVVRLPDKPVGTAYPATTLYEHFTCADGGCDFENILGVHPSWEPPPTGAPRRYRVSYWFNTGITATTPWKNLSLESDGGEIWGRDDGATTTVFMRKELKFNSDIATGATQGVFEVHQDELAGELAEMACCPVPAP